MPTYSGATQSPFAKSVLIGAYGGMVIQFIITTRFENVPLSELWLFPVIIAVYGLFALPIVAIGLAVFGLPASAILQTRVSEWWVGIIALVWGGVAGKLVYYAVDQFIFLGRYKLTSISHVDLGLIYGITTALAWWLLQRREIEAS